MQLHITLRMMDRYTDHVVLPRRLAAYEWVLLPYSYGLDDFTRYVRFWPLALSIAKELNQVFVFLYP